MKFLLFFIVFLSAIFCPLFAQEKDKEQNEPVKLEEIVVTAERIPAPISEVGSSTTVITQEDIKKTNLKTVSEVIRNATGVDVTQSGGSGQITTTFLRGAESRHTLVLVDGVKINDPMWGGFNFADLTLDNIERIEILKGPQSTLYGSDAIGGVINIITKKGEGAIGGSLKSEFGSFATFKESFQLRGAAGTPNKDTL